LFTKLDLYIIKKIVSTFFFSIISVLSIAVVFDISEKLDDFLKANMSAFDIALGYYAGFVVYIGNMFFPLFVLITIVMVTIKMNQRSEITAILSTGISFNRLLRPFFVGTGIIVMFSFVINMFLLPEANQRRLNFENVHTNYTSVVRDGHLEVEPGTIVSFQTYDIKQRQYVSKMWVDKFEKDSTGKEKLVYTLYSDYAYGDSAINKWNLRTVQEHFYVNGKDSIVRSSKLDTSLSFKMSDLGQRTNVVSTMYYNELITYRNKELTKGSPIVPFIEIEIYSRTANPLSLFILALLGVCISISPARSRVGVTILIGIGTVAIYFVFNRFTTVAATNAGLNPFMAVWLPNIMLLIFAIFIYIKTPK
jgi:lipopolysaccharide export system permease protein